MEILEKVQNWDLRIGDRKTEIVFIGQDMNEAAMTAKLDECLLTNEEFEAMDLEQGYNDDWPVYRAHPVS